MSREDARVKLNGSDAEALFASAIFNTVVAPIVITGAVSSSVIVTVASAPADGTVTCVKEGAEIVTVKASDSSKISSSVMSIANVPLVSPSAIVKLPPAGS